jgi:hypothetical protein
LARTLDQLESLKTEYGGGAAGDKLDALGRLERLHLGRARDVLRLHEALCFLRAYPDGAEVLALVERMLLRFHRRRDLRRHRRALADSGIAGTEIRFRFFAPVAFRLGRRWGERLRVDWRPFRNAARLEALLPLLALPAEAPGLDEWAFSVRRWLRRLKGPGETDAAFLTRRFLALPMDDAARERLYDDLDPPLVLSPGPDTPSRTLAFHPVRSVAFQTGPLDRARPRLAQEVRRPPVSIRVASPREGRALVDLACDAMVTRQRDLDVFSYGDPGDVRVIDCGRGLQLAAIGFLPERRLLLESVYGFLMLKNGVPIGYALTSALYGSSEIAYNVFDTFRGGEAGAVFGRVIAAARALFGSDAFTIVPYQLGGDGNEEAIRSGAFWFYQKLGFAPRDPGVRRVLKGELARLQRDRRHRSDASTLKTLASANVHWSAGRERSDVLGLLPLPNVGLAVTAFVAARFGSAREAAARECSREAAALLGIRSLRGWGPEERLAFERWSPLVVILPGVGRWSSDERRRLAEVVRAKGSRRESDFVRLFDRHRRLRRAVRDVAERAAPA